jgi:hypothetical protein
MKDDGLQAVDHPLDEHSRLPVRGGDRSKLRLPCGTSGGRRSYVHGRRIRLLYTLLLIVAAAAGGAWFAGTYIPPPAKMATRVAPSATVAHSGGGRGEGSKCRCRCAWNGSLWPAAADIACSSPLTGRGKSLK